MNLRIAVLQSQDVVFIEKPVYNYLTNRPDSALTSYINTFDLDYEIRILDYLTLALKSEGFIILFKKEIAFVYLMHIWGWKKKFLQARKEHIVRLKYFSDFVLINRVSINYLFKVAVVYFFLLLGYFNNYIFFSQSLARVKKSLFKS